MRGLRMLDLGSNTSITDIRPLARLVYLEKEKTYLPETISAADKENLFAAIEVNKLFNKFNISRMKASDSDNVGKALEAYDVLDDTQKAFFDDGRIQAARDNKRLVDEGQAPVYYEEYDEDGEAQPVLDRLQITVVDKRGNPAEGITFLKRGVGERDYVTDKNGTFEIIHTLNDSNWDQSLALKDKGYVSIPEKIEYEVKDGKTYIVNGKRVTGFEQYQIMVIPENEYVDKAQLKEILESTAEVEEEYKYTQASYKAYADALKAAQDAYENVDAEKETVDTAAVNLKNAVNALTKTDVLAELKLIVKDKNGNTFTRPFKFQIYETGTRANAWNCLSNEETGVAYLSTYPGWTNGKSWTVAACQEEPYEIDTFDVIIGVKDDGQIYYKTVDGKPAGPDFEKIVTVRALPGGAIDKTNERKPESSVLEKRIEAAKLYAAADYTEKSFSALQEAIEAAEAVVAGTDAVQEDYNAAAAALGQAVEGLKEQADTIALEKALERYEISYTATSFTSDTWKKYEAEYTSAKAVYEDKNAAQEQVDSALAKLTAAEKSLALKADKRELSKILENAKELKEEDYLSGYEDLQAAIEEAQKVIDNAEAVQSEADEVLAKLTAAIDALEEKPVERDYECYPMIFRALVKDEQDKPLSGVTFKVQIEGVDRTETVKSDKDGIVEYAIDGNDHGKKTTVSLDDVRYTTTDEHWFITKGTSPWIFSIETLDGEDYVYGMRLTYTLHITGVENPNPVDPDPVDPDPIDPDPVVPDPGKTDKKDLKEQIDIADSMRNRASDYTEESFGAMLAALEEAQAVFDDENATAETIAASMQKLKKAREELKAAKKPVVCDRSHIRILLKDKNGNKIADSTEFYMTIGFGRPILMPFRNGVLEYDMTDADYGVKTITISAPEEGIELNGEKYLVSPEQHEFTIESSSLGVFIAEIDGQELEEAGREVSFVLTRETPEEVTQWSADCFTYEGNILTGFSEAGREYLEKNPDVIIPEKSDMGETVTEIAAEAFENCGMKSVELPSFLLKIGEKAFAGNSIASVKLPDQIKEIARDAFSNNEKAVTLEISDKKVLEYVKNAGLEGIVVEDNTSEEQPGPEQPGLEQPGPEQPGPEQPGSEQQQSKVKVKKIAITGSTNKIAAGKKITLKAKVTPSNATVKGITWKSQNTKVATVNSKGVVTIKKNAGGKTVLITATAKDGSKVTGKYKLTVMKGVVKKIQISGAKLSVKAGKNLKLQAKVTASKGANKKLVWTSSNEKYAKVSASGNVKTYKAGKGKKVKITAKAVDGSGKKKSVTIKIK